MKTMKILVAILIILVLAMIFCTYKMNKRIDQVELRQDSTEIAIFD